MHARCLAAQRPCHPGWSRWVWIAGQGLATTGPGHSGVCMQLVPVYNGPPGLCAQQHQVEILTQSPGITNWAFAAACCSTPTASHPHLTSSLDIQQAVNNPPCAPTPARSSTPLCTFAQAEYWRQLLEGPPPSPTSQSVPAYGNDVEGTAFSDRRDDAIASSNWNLGVRWLSGVMS